MREQELQFTEEEQNCNSWEGTTTQSHRTEATTQAHRMDHTAIRWCGEDHSSDSKDWTMAPGSQEGITAPSSAETTFIAHKSVFTGSQGGNIAFAHEDEG